MIQNCINSKTFTPLQQLLDKENTSDFVDLLTDVVAFLSSVAMQLNEDVPKVEFDTPGLRIAEAGQGLIVNVFAHILRNRLDHCIEATKERRSQGKEPFGFISISSLVLDGALGLNRLKLIKSQS